MDNSGIITQYGFEYQKLAFLYCAIQINNTDIITYEGQDDVEIEEEKTLWKFQTLKSLCQVKSGDVTPTVFKKIILNWLLKMEQAESFICISENKVPVHDGDFADTFTKEIIESSKRKDALISKVKVKYSTQKNTDDLKADIKKLLSEAKYLALNVNALLEESIKKFGELYCTETEPEVISRERYLMLCDNIHKNITQSILRKEEYALSYRELFGEISTVREAITDSKYDIPFMEFKKKSDATMTRILASQSDAVRQLKLVFPKNEQAVMQELTKKMFYEDLRQHFVDINKKEEINALEYLAKENYEITLQDFEGYGEVRTPYKTFRNTIEKPLSAPLPSESSSNFLYYRHGCYIHLTDTGIDEYLKIKWGEIEDETN